MLKQEALSFFIGSCKGSGLRAFVLFCTLLSFSSVGGAMTYLCKNDKSVRTLRTEKADDGSCKAIYTKQGVDQVVGSSTHEDSCVTVIDGIRKTLEESVWKCKDVAAQISYLSGE